MQQIIDVFFVAGQDGAGLIPNPIPWVAVYLLICAAIAFTEALDRSGYGRLEVAFVAMVEAAIVTFVMMIALYLAVSMPPMVALGILIVIVMAALVGVVFATVGRYLNRHF